VKTFLAIALVILSSAAMAKGDYERKGANGDEPGTVEETERMLLVKCPEGTKAAGVEAVEAVQDDDTVDLLMIVECNYPE
jgi:hypothetical protein